jgi:hypothetical protein
MYSGLLATLGGSQELVFRFTEVQYSITGKLVKFVLLIISRKHSKTFYNRQLVSRRSSQEKNPLQ